MSHTVGNADIQVNYNTRCNCEAVGLVVRLVIVQFVVAKGSWLPQCNLMAWCGNRLQCAEALAI